MKQQDNCSTNAAHFSLSIPSVSKSDVGVGFPKENTNQNILTMELLWIFPRIRRNNEEQNHNK